MPESATDATLAVSKAKRIFVVEEPNVARLIKTCLERCGYQVTISEDEGKVIAKIKAEKTHMLILHANVELINAIRSVPDTSNLPILMTFLLHETSPDPDAEYWLNRGANAGLRKPFSPNDLIAAVEKTLLSIKANAPQILVADDEPFITGLIAKNLVPRGYHVEAARNGMEALAKIIANPPALLITDLIMPEMNGFELIKAIRSNAEVANLPIIFMVPWMDSMTNPSPERFLREGANLILFKPFNIKELVGTVGEMLLQFPAKDKS